MVGRRVAYSYKLILTAVSIPIDYCKLYGSNGKNWHVTRHVLVTFVHFGYNVVNTTRHVRKTVSSGTHSAVEAGCQCHIRIGYRPYHVVK